MATELQDPCGFHSADAGPDYSNFLRRCGRETLLTALPEDIRIDRAHQRLRTHDTADAAIVAADAGADILGIPFISFVRPLRVRKQRPAQGNRVDCSVPNRFIGHFGPENAAGTDNGYVHLCGKRPHVVQPFTFRKIHRGVLPEQSVIASIADKESVAAGLFEDFAQLDALRDVPSDLPIGLPRDLPVVNGRHMVARCEAACYGKISAAALLNAFDGFHGNARSAVDVAAVFIGTVVKQGSRELIPHVSAVSGNDIDAVGTALLADFRRVDMRLYNSTDFFRRHCPVLDFGVP